MFLRILVYYDFVLLICLVIDVLLYGVRAVIFYIMLNDLEKFVVFVLWIFVKELDIDGKVLFYMFGFVVIKLLNVIFMCILVIMEKFMVLRF